LSRFASLRRALGALFVSLLLAFGAGSARADGVEALPSAERDGRTVVDESPLLVPARRSERIKGEVLTKHFRILYTAKSEAAARELAEKIEQVRDAFLGTLGRDWPGTTEVRLGMGREEYEELALGDKPPTWALALAYPQHNIILLEASSLTRPDGFATVAHELSHVALGQLGKDWPHWFQEGVAMHLSGERYGLEHYAVMFRAVRQERIVSFESLTDSWPRHAPDVEFAYAQSLAFVDYLVEEQGPQKLGELIDEVHSGELFNPAFARTFKVTLSLAEEKWAKQLPVRYAWLPFSLTNSMLWLLAAALCVAAFAVRQARKARRLEELAAEDEAEDAARRLLAAEGDVEDPYLSPENPFAGLGLSDEPTDPFGDMPKGPAKPTIH